MISYLYFLRAKNTNHLPTSFYFLGFFFSNHKSNMNPNNTDMRTKKKKKREKKKERKEKKEKQSYDPAIWFLGIYQRNKHKYTGEVVYNSKQKPETL